jgi:hypothetical protein
MVFHGQTVADVPADSCPVLVRVTTDQTVAPQVKRHRLSAATFVDVAMEATVAGHGCRLVLRVSAYEWPDEVSGSDANWLTGEVELQPGRTGVFHACHGAALRTEELAQFRDELQVSHGHS